MSDEVPRTRRKESGCNIGLRIVRKQDVTSNLFSHKPTPPLVFIERTDHVIAIRVRVPPGLVLVVAVRFAEVNDVKPVPCPAFAVTGRGKQTIHEPLVSAWRLISHKLIELFNGGRESMKVVRDAADERAPIRFGRGRQT